MEEFQADAANMVMAARTAWQQASALAVEYSFSVVGAIILLIAGFLVAGMLERSAFAALGRVRGFDQTLRLFFSRIVRYGVLLLVGVTVLAQFGVQTASIIATLGAVGIALGLALQGTLQNIAAGIMLLALRPFRVGEYVDAGSVSGTIVDIGLFATELKAADGVFVLAPNSELWKGPVKNYSRNALRRTDVTIGIGYEDDLGLAQETLRGLMRSDSRVLAEPEPAVFVAELGESAVGVTARYWTATPDAFQTSADLTRAAKLAFDATGISIPYPQREVRVIQTNGAAGSG